MQKMLLDIEQGDDYDEYDTDEDKTRKGKYQFRFVGLALTNKLVVIVFPKYMATAPSPLQLRSLLRVIRLRSGSFTTFDRYSLDGLVGDKRISLILEILESYFEYGEYSNYVDEIEIDGSGDISWPSTISSFNPYLIDEQPVYLNLKTRKTERNDADLITRVHKAVIADSYRELSECELLEVFEIDVIDVSNEPIAEIGDVDYLLAALHSERSKQFLTWKQHVIDLLITYLEDSLSTHLNAEIQCLGTTSFHVDWEKACKKCFGDMLDKKIGDLGINLSKPWKAISNTRLIDIIPSPEWHVVDMDGNEVGCTDAQTFLPDLVSINPRTSAFNILDAKYYTPVLKAGKRPSGQPGVESVAKQFLYQEAYSEFVISNGFHNVVNAFFVPTEEQTPHLLGTVKIPGVLDDRSSPFSNVVEMWGIPADTLFNNYLGNMRQPLPWENTDNS